MACGADVSMLRGVYEEDAGRLYGVGIVDALANARRLMLCSCLAMECFCKVGAQLADIDTNTYL